MKKRNTILSILAILLLVISSGRVKAQALNEAIENLSSEIIQSYASSAINSFGANLNSAWLNRVPSPVVAGFSFSFGIYGVMSPLKQGPNTFKTNGSFYLTREQAQIIVDKEISEVAIRSQVVDQLVNVLFNLELTGATITGDNIDGLEVYGYADEDLIFKVKHPDVPFPVRVKINQTELRNIELKNYLSALNYLPGGAAQLNLGTVYGTEAMIRFVPNIDAGDEVGSVGMFGFGLLHNPAVWFKNPLPVQLSVGFLSQNISLGNKGDISSFAAGVTVHKNLEFGWLGISPFVSLMTESTSFDITEKRTFDTNYGEESVNIRLKFDAENSARAVIGTVFKMSFIDLTFSYALAKHNAMVGGLSFNFDFFN